MLAAPKTKLEILISVLRTVTVRAVLLLRKRKRRIETVSCPPQVAPLKVTSFRRARAIFGIIVRRGYIPWPCRVLPDLTSSSRPVGVIIPVFQRGGGELLYLRFTKLLTLRAERFER